MLDSLCLMGGRWWRARCCVVMRGVVLRRVRRVFVCVQLPSSPPSPSPSSSPPPPLPPPCVLKARPVCPTHDGLEILTCQ